MVAASGVARTVASPGRRDNAIPLLSDTDRDDEDGDAFVEADSDDEDGASRRGRWPPVI